MLFAFVLVSTCLFCAQTKADSDNGENEEGPGYLDIYTDTTWHKDDDLAYDKVISVFPGATLTIEAGARIRLGKIDDWTTGSIEVMGGRIVANGTQTDPIIIEAVSESKNYLINFRNDIWTGIPPAQPSFMRYVEISGGGYAQDSECPGCTSYFSKFIPTAYASSEGMPALRFESGKVHMENCTFRENIYADVGVEYDQFREDSAGSYLEIVNSNFEKNADSLAIESVTYCKADDPDCGKMVLLKNNWYDGAHGPITDSSYANADGKKLVGVFDLDNWRANAMLSDPVIVIPGIMGTADTLSGWQLDPILHTYDNLMGGLEDNGYAPGQNLFAFIYDWREDNQLSAQHLQAKVEAVISETKVSKVDLVAHSMGGLIARAYIEEAVDQDKYPVRYGDTVEKLITLGTPERGAPEAYLQWEAGEGFFSWKENVIKHHFSVEAEHAGYDELYRYIREKVPSVGQLLPDYDYLRETNGETRSYSQNYPRNTFLERLNKAENVAKLSGVELVNIVGKSNDTISTITVGKPSLSDDSIWAHGKPENFDLSSSDRGLSYGDGDGTVPLSSAKALDKGRIIETEFAHQALPDEAQCDVFHELTGSAVCVKNNAWHMTNILLVNLFSPVDVQVVAPADENGARKRVGRDFDHPGQIFNEIDGAYYTGYENVDNEFITIPDPQDGQYQIITKGTGSGDYRVEVVKIDQDGTGPARESVTDLVGTTSAGDIQEQAVEIRGGKVVGDDVDTVDVQAPTIELQKPQDGEKHSNDRILRIEYVLSDDQSPAEKISAKVFWDGAEIEKSEVDLRLQLPGEHKLKITATDEAGNVGTAEAVIMVSTDAATMIKNVGYYYQEHLIKTRQEKNWLQSQLLAIKLSQELLTGLKNTPFMFSARTRHALIVGLENSIVRQIDWLEGQIKMAFSNRLSPTARQLLLAGLEYLKN